LRPCSSLLLLALPLATIARAQDTTAKKDTTIAKDTVRTHESLAQYFNLDKLRLDGLGLAGGVAMPLQIQTAAAYSAEADYGELVPHWRLFFGAAVWSSHFSDAAVRNLINTIYTNSVIKPNSADTLQYKRIDISDVALNIDIRYSPFRGQSFLRPYLDGGVVANVQDVSGSAIHGTIVERQLDGISPGIAAAAGVEMRVTRWLIADGQARYDLQSGDRFATFRAGLRYLFQPERRAR
jgi:opacity protein-like surface antigen